MNIIIEPIINEQDAEAAYRLRQQVFEREMGIAFAHLKSGEAAWAIDLLAREDRGSEAAAVLSMVETSDDDALHQRYNLDFPRQARIARYTQLAVLPRYRGLNLPLKLIYEANQRFIVPGAFDYTWLLFDAERAATSRICQRLAFTPSAQVYMSDYGRTRTLVRDEHAAQSQTAMRQVEQYLKRTSSIFTPAGPTPRRG